MLVKNEESFQITREKHLDHMVRVVPFIVFCYGIQSFVIFNMNPGEFSTISLSVLGGFISLMIASFIFYDLQHQVHLNSSDLTIQFLFKKCCLRYEDIQIVEVKDPGQTFSNLIIKTKHEKYIFYFIDDAEKIKMMIQEKKKIELKAA